MGDTGDPDDDEDFELSEEDLLMMDALEGMEGILDEVKAIAVIHTVVDDEGGPEEEGKSDVEDQSDSDEA